MKYLWALVAVAFISCDMQTIRNLRDIAVENRENALAQFDKDLYLYCCGHVDCLEYLLLCYPIPGEENLQSGRRTD